MAEIKVIENPYKKQEHPTCTKPRKLKVRRRVTFAKEEVKIREL